MPQATISKRRSTRDFKRPHWSYSQLSQYVRCPLQYYFERVAKLPRPFTPSSMAFGSAIHEGLAAFHRGLMHGEPITPTEIHAAFRTSWQDNENERPIRFRDGESTSDLLEQGVALLETYLAETPPENVVAVEQAYVVPLQTSEGRFLAKPLVAIIDLLTRELESLTVTEFKTSGRRYNEFEADTTLQASCYGHAVHQHFDEAPKIKYTVLVRTKTPAVQHLETGRTDADYTRLGDTVEGIERAIQAKAFFPIESPMNCSGCPFRVECRDWQGCHSLTQIKPLPMKEREVARC